MPILKSLCDLTQILLGYGPFGAAALAVLVLQGGKMLRMAWRRGWECVWLVGAEARRWVIRVWYTRNPVTKEKQWGGVLTNIFRGCVLYFVFSAFAPQISNSIQWAEQTWWPIYLAEVEADTSSAASAAYERRIQRNLGPTDYALFVRRTAEIAAKCRSSPLAFYEVYESECSCDPFAVNQREYRDRAGRLVRDTVAAGQIQFTAAGVSGLVLNDEPVTMRKVKDAIRSRRLAWLMDLQEVYMARASGDKPLPRPCDVYTAVFMPKFVGCSGETVLASRWDKEHPEFYWQNIGLDGWQLSASGKVLHLDSARDGKITINDLALCLAAKKAAVCRAEKNPAYD